MDSVPLQVRQALNKAHKAVKADPRNSDLHKVIAPLYEEHGFYEEAVPHLAFLVSNAGRADEALYGRYIKALQRCGQLNKAQHVTDEGLLRCPGSNLLLKHRALNCMLLRDFEQAGQTYATPYASDPSDVYAAGMAGTMKLLASDMREGYEEYALRPHEPMMLRLLGAVPRWTGEALKGKRLILWDEQGIGDVIMFLGMLGWPAVRDASITLALPSKLASLCKRSFPEAALVSELSVSAMANGQFDFHLPLGDLIAVGLRAYVPAQLPSYLVADAAKSEHLRSGYLDIAKDRGRTRLIGLSWHTTNPHVGFTRNVTLHELHPILSIPGVQFVSLQYGNHAEEVAECNRRVQDILYQDSAVDAFNDIDGLAAQMAAMDEIITIDNVTVHLAGALGLPTTVLLPFSPDWRWGLTGSNCLWYKSVRLERQEALLKWQPVIKRVREHMLRTMADES